MLLKPVILLVKRVQGPLRLTVLPVSQDSISTTIVAVNVSNLDRICSQLP